MLYFICRQFGAPSHADLFYVLHLDELTLCFFSGFSGPCPKMSEIKVFDIFEAKWTGGVILHLQETSGYEKRRFARIHFSVFRFFLFFGSVVRWVWILWFPYSASVSSFSISFVSELILFFKFIFSPIFILIFSLVVSCSCWFFFFPFRLFVTADSYVFCLLRFFLLIFLLGFFIYPGAIFVYLLHAYVIIGYLFLLL